MDHVRLVALGYASKAPRYAPGDGKMEMERKREERELGRREGELILGGYGKGVYRDELRVMEH